MYSRSYFGVPPEVDDGFAGGMQVSRQAPFDVAEILRSIKTELSRLWGDISVQGELRSFKDFFKRQKLPQDATTKRYL